mmetsp:Transcript_16923/g.46466  ORF Transcript_16923/g.46466 Transcript_16923/m.46466 type:complete len:87 (-) Transcript_16923:810-1070(-)
MVPVADARYVAEGGVEFGAFECGVMANQQSHSTWRDGLCYAVAVAVAAAVVEAIFQFDEYFGEIVASLIQAEDVDARLHVMLPSSA